MRTLKPAPGEINLRKLTPKEAITLNLHKKLANKVRIMTNSDGTISFWSYKNKTGELTRYAEFSEDYFDEVQANTKLEQYWSMYTNI